MKTILVKTLFVCFALSACTKNSSNQQNDYGYENAAIPRFSVEAIELDRSFEKASFKIRLNEKLSEKDIETIAQDLKNRNPGFKRYFISYYLPSMTLGDVAWATSHFNPNLSVKIQGISNEAEVELKTRVTIEGEVVGKWFDDRPFVESTLIIYRQNTVYKLRQTYRDGSFADKELKKIANTFTYENDFGEYLKIESDGALGLYSENGKFASATKIEK
jgi:hypothetical protein